MYINHYKMDNVIVKRNETEMTLSPEQEQAIEAFNNNHNIFLTGPGGSGKTTLIQKMVEISKKKGKNVQVCALTGCAAVLLNCQAKTIHSWAGIGLASGDVDAIVRKVISSKYKSANWKKVDILIIDEVSMMSHKIFELLDTIGKRVRKSTSQLPFGGIQVVFSGDFYQLPPVNSSAYSAASSSEPVDQAASAFCFESPLWNKTFHVDIELKTIFRQTDTDYKKILNQIRVGKLTKSSLEKLTPHINKPLPESFKPTILLPRRRDAELINLSELSKLTTEEKKYTLSMVLDTLPESAGATSSNTNTSSNTKKQIHQQQQQSFSDEQREMEYNFLVNNILADKEVILKKGAQVMCIANIDNESADPIVNGSQGIIVDFVGNLPLVKFNNGVKRTIGYHVWNSENIPVIGVKQIPLIYAWAITIHKSQGVSLDMAQIDAGSNIFECGQTYVALSRIKTLDGLYLSAFNPQKIKVNKKVQAYYKKYMMN